MRRDPEDRGQQQGDHTFHGIAFQPQNEKPYT
jgi:hypothetical protein